MGLFCLGPAKGVPGRLTLGPASDRSTTKNLSRQNTFSFSESRQKLSWRYDDSELDMSPSRRNCAVSSAALLAFLPARQA